MTTTTAQTTDTRRDEGKKDCRCFGCRTESRFGCIALAHRLGTVDAVIAQQTWEAK
jgi:hypothetical protein